MMMTLACGSKGPGINGGEAPKLNIKGQLPTEILNPIPPCVHVHILPVAADSFASMQKEGTDIFGVAVFECSDCHQRWAAIAKSIPIVTG
jgi:hypothetical protein